MTGHAEVRAHNASVSLIGRFVAIAFAFAWLQWFAVIASARHWLPWHVPLTPLGSFGPAIAAALLLPGKEARRAWWASLRRWRVRPVVILSACFLLPLAAAACFAVASSVKGDWSRPALPGIGIILAASLEILLLGGPLGEEPGWRGFLLPELRKSLSAFQASVVVGLLWFAWHLPLFWVPGAPQQELSMWKFAVALLAYSFVLTWLMEVGKATVLMAIVFHTSANVTFWMAAVAVSGKRIETVFWNLYFSSLVLVAVILVSASKVFRKPYEAAMPG